MAHIRIPRDEEKKSLETVLARTDIEATRIQRYLEMKDLSRTVGSPIKQVVDEVQQISSLKNFDVIEIPEIVPAKESFDLFNFPENHPARSTSDTYYIDTDHILRTHTTIMWWYYLNHPDIRARIEKEETLGVLSYGKVFRKDEIDRNHMNIFHQVDGLFLTPKKEKVLDQEDLKAVLTEIAQTIFGNTIKYRFNPDTFPYTHSSLEMEVDKGGQWVEVLGAGVVDEGVLKKLNIDPDIYNGWAFGFGLERLAIISMELPDIRLLWSTDERVTKQLVMGQKFQEVSKYPPVVRDISFVVQNTFEPNSYFDLIREIGGDTVEQVELLDKYENEEKFGKGNISYTFRTTYRHLNKTLTSAEVDAIHKEIEMKTMSLFSATIR